MAIAAKLYASFPENLGGGNTAGEGPMDLLSDTINCALNIAHTEDQTAHTVWADVSANEVTGTAYVSKGAALATKVYAATALVTKFDADDTTWAASTITADGHWIFDDTPTSPADPLIAYSTYGGNQSTVGTTFQITWNASGIFSITVA